MNIKKRKTTLISPLKIFYNLLFCHTSPLQLCFHTHLWHNEYIPFLFWLSATSSNRLQHFLFFVLYLTNILILITFLFLIWFFLCLFIIITDIFTLLILFRRKLWFILTQILLISHTTTKVQLEPLCYLSTLHCLFSICNISAQIINR